MRLLLFLFLIPLANAVIVMNSSQLANTTVQVNETLFIEDWNATIEIINNTIFVQQEFNHSDVNVTYEQSLDLFGNFTVHGPAACPQVNLTEQFQNLSHDEVQNFVGNWTVGCYGDPPDGGNAFNPINLQPNETKALNGTFNVTCLPPAILSFSETKALGYNQSISKNLTNQFSSVFFNYTCPPQETQIQHVPQPLSIDESIAPGSCYEKKEGNLSIEICAEDPPECKPEIKTEYQTLYDLGKTASCEDPVMVKGQPLCYESLSGYCPADVMLNGGCEGCTKYAVETVLAIQEGNLSDCNALVLDLRGQTAQLQGQYNNASADLARKNAEKLGWQLTFQEVMQPLILMVILFAVFAGYWTHFHKDKSLPTVNRFLKSEKPAFKRKL